MPAGEAGGGGGTTAPRGRGGAQPRGTEKRGAGTPGSCSPAALPGSCASTCLFVLWEAAMAPRPTAALRLLQGSWGWHPNQELVEEAWETSEGKDLLGFSV